MRGWGLSILIKMLKMISEKFSDQIAVKSDLKTISFHELDSLSDNLAQRISGKIKLGEKIGVIHTRDIDLIIIILGILKAGGVYVPIDFSSPKNRIEYIIDNANIHLTIGHKKYQCLIDNINFLTIPELLDEKVKNKKLPELNENSNAYVIYTSGTTGNPKGVVIPHGNITTLINSIKDANIYVDHNDRWTMFHSYAFDVSIWEIFGAALTGGQLHIIKDKDRVNLSNLLMYIVENNISVLSLTPSVFKQLLHQNRIDTLQNSSLKYIIFGGERFDLTDYKKWIELFPDNNQTSLINMYGITETTVHTTAYKLSPSNLKDISTSPIGKPLSHFTIKLLDSNQNEVKPGETGEIYVSGSALAKEYLNNKPLTDERFLEVSLKTDETPTRYYKSGDLAILKNNIFYYIGRSDRQVKFHGYRVELDGVEKSVLNNKSVENCLVEIIKEGETERMLCFYQSDSIISDSVFHEKLSKIIPNYMIPNVFEHYKKLPVNVNGKIDKKILIETYLQKNPTEDLLKSKNENIRKLASIWHTVLKHENISLKSNFFKIGGYSLLVAEVTNKVAITFNVDIKIKDLIKNPIFSNYLKVIEKSSAIDKTQEKELESILLPPAPNQRGLYFTCQLREVTEYNMGFVFYLNKSIAHSVLADAINKIIQSQCAFKMYFTESNGEIKINLDESRYCIMEEENFNNLSELKEKAAEWNKHTFELKKYPLFYFKFGSVNDNTYIYLNMHHIITDGFSINIFTNLLLLLLNGENIKKDFSYTQFIINANGTGQSKKVSDFWKNYLDGISSIEVKLPKSNLKNSLDVNHLKITWSHIKNDTVENYCKRIGISPYTFYLIAYGLMISDVSNNYDFIVGVPYANREPRYMESIGFYVNSLPIRISFNKELSILDFLKYSNTLNNNLLAHQGDDLSYILKESKVHGHNFSVFFAYQKEIATITHYRDMSCTPIPIHNNTSKFDLVLFITFEKDGLTFRFEFDSKKLSLSYVEILGQKYLEFIDHLLTMPPQTNIKSILKKERKLPLYHHVSLTGKKHTLEYNNVIEMFYEQVLKSKGNTALEDKTKHYTYTELDNLSTRLALKIKQNWPNEKYIGLYFSRSCETIIYIISVLKSGKAYIPIHRDFPKDRIQYICDKAKIKALISNIAKIDALPESVLATEFSKDIEKYPSRMQIKVRAASCAYAMFTSGTTGNPKGVSINHESLVNRITWMMKQYQIDEKDTFICKTPFIFDVSFGEIFLPLCSGGKLFIAEPDGHKDFNYLINTIKAKHITHTYFVPTMLNVFLDYLQYEKITIDSLKIIFTSGEALMQKSVDKCKMLIPNARVINQYGPTEAGEVCDYEANAHEPYKIVPLGFPMFNTNFLILNEHGKPAMTDEPGELYLSGVCLSTGYLDDPLMTSKSFIQLENYGLAYKTSDLVIKDHKNILHYLSRLDNQYKINGVRIELSEIEHNILHVDGVKHAFVMVENNTLIAFFEQVSDTVTEQNIYENLSLKLPKYMLPSKIIEVKEFKVTVNGKIDKKHLIDTYLKSEALQVDLSEYSEPQKKIIEIWTSLLNIKLGAFNIDDLFFNLGGNSILVAKLILKLHQELNLNVTISDFVNCPNLSFLLSLVEEKKKIIPSMISISKKIIDDINRYQDKFTCSKMIERVIDIKSILVTGGTGFIGRNFIKIITKQYPGIHVYCATTSIEKYNALVKNNYFSSGSLKQITPIEINLEKEQLLLDDVTYDKLCHDIDAVVHIAAYVNHLYGYEAHAPANVKGTYELLSFCTKIKRKKFIFISSTGCNLVKPTSGFANFVDYLPDIEKLNGYIQSKISAEQLVFHAIKHSLPAKILRLGYVGPHSQTNELVVKDNHVSSLIKMVLEKNCFPDWPHSFECLPVDVIASSIIYELNDNDSIPIKYLSNARIITWNDFFSLVNKNAKRLTHHDWYHSILTQASIEENYLYKLIPLYSEHCQSDSIDLSGEIVSDISYQDMVNLYIRAIEVGHKI